jgi:hypothetical protein
MSGINIEFGFCEDIDIRVDRLLKNRSMPSGVMTDHFRDFLKRAIVVKERFKKEGIDYLFKEKIFEFQKMDESDSSTYQHVINIEIDTNLEEDATNTKFKNFFVSSFRITNCFKGSTSISNLRISFDQSDTEHVKIYGENKGHSKPFYSYLVTFHENTQTFWKIFITDSSGKFNRVITWDANGKLISDEKDYFIGTEEWHKEQLELQKQLEQKRKKEEEDDE